VRLHRPEQPGSRLGDLDEHILLLLGIALDRADQVRDQVGASLQLHLDLLLRGLRLLVVLLDRVIPAPAEGEGKGEGHPSLPHRVSS